MKIQPRLAGNRESRGENAKKCRQNRKIRHEIGKKVLKIRKNYLWRWHVGQISAKFHPYELEQFDKNTLRWHVVMFVSEFTLKHDFALANFGEYPPPYGKSPRSEKLQFLEPTDYLNWSGRDLYERLKNDLSETKTIEKEKEIK